MSEQVNQEAVPGFLLEMDLYIDSVLQEQNLLHTVLDADMISPELVEAREEIKSRISPFMGVKVDLTADSFYLLEGFQLGTIETILSAGRIVGILHKPQIMGIRFRHDDVPRNHAAIGLQLCPSENPDIDSTSIAVASIKHIRSIRFGVGEWSN